MNFNLKIYPAGDQLSFESGSGLVKFFFDTKKLEKVTDEFFKSLELPLGKTQMQNLLDKKTGEVVYHSHKENPSEIFIKKIKIDENFTSDFFRDYFAGFIPSLKKKNLTELHIIVPDFKGAGSTEYLFSKISVVSPK